MDQKQAIALVREYKEAIKGLLDNPRVYLYGSYSKGTATPEKGIDEAIVIHEQTDNWFSVMPQLLAATRKVSTLLEPVLLADVHPSLLYDDVIRSGIAVA